MVCFNLDWSSLNILFETFNSKYNGKKFFFYLHIVCFCGGHWPWGVANWLVILHEARPKTLFRCVALEFGVSFGVKVLQYWRLWDQLLDSLKTATLNFFIPQELILLLEELPQWCCCLRETEREISVSSSPYQRALLHLVYSVVGISRTPWIFAGSGFSPSSDMTCPINETSERRNLHFSWFNLLPLLLHLSNRAVRRWSWFSTASALVSPTPKIRMSLKIGTTPWSPARAVSRHHWNSSGAGEIPNDILVQR